MKKIVFKVDLNSAEVEMEAVGFGGSGCRDATKAFEEALGFVKDRTNKPVYWNAQGTDEQHIKVEG